MKESETGRLGAHLLEVAEEEVTLAALGQRLQPKLGAVEGEGKLADEHEHGEVRAEADEAESGAS